MLLLYYIISPILESSMISVSHDCVTYVMSCHTLSPKSKIIKINENENEKES